MYNELLNDEMKQLMKKVEEMVKQQNKNQLKQEMENLQLNNKDVEKELDKMLEMNMFTVKVESLLKVMMVGQIKLQTKREKILHIQIFGVMELAVT